MQEVYLKHDIKDWKLVDGNDIIGNTKQKKSDINFRQYIDFKVKAQIGRTLHHVVFKGMKYMMSMLKNSGKPIRPWELIEFGKVAEFKN